MEEWRDTPVLSILLNSWRLQASLSGLSGLQGAMFGHVDCARPEGVKPRNIFSNRERSDTGIGNLTVDFLAVDVSFLSIVYCHHQHSRLQDKPPGPK